MALTKQNLTINFAQGLDTKTDPLQVPIGKMLSLQNAVFSKGGLLQKRNGFASLKSVNTLGSPLTALSTFNGELVAITSGIYGGSLYAYGKANNSWTQTGPITTTTLSVLSAARAANSITWCDSAIASNGLSCVVYTDTTAGLSYYKIIDVNNQQTVMQDRNIGTIGNPRVVVLNDYFIIVAVVKVSGVYYLRYLRIPSSNPTIFAGSFLDFGATTIITTGYTVPISVSVFGGVPGNPANPGAYLYASCLIASGVIKTTSMSQGFVQGNTISISTGVGTNVTEICVTADNSSPIDPTTGKPNGPPSGNIWIAYYDVTSTNGYAYCYDKYLQTVIQSALNFVTTGAGPQAQGLSGVCYVDEFFIYWGQKDLNAFTPSAPYTNTKLNSLWYNTLTSAGFVAGPNQLTYGLTPASRPFAIGNNVYILCLHNSTFQPTYYLLDGFGGQVVAKIAYQNAVNSMAPNMVPNATVVGTSVIIPYLFVDQITSVNKTQVASQVGGFYQQAGVNIAKVQFYTRTSGLEIGGDLHLTSSPLMMFDGNAPVEHGFYYYPDDIGLTQAAGAGFMTVQQYFYCAVFTWADAAGNVHKSAPSVPVGITVSANNTTVTINLMPYYFSYKGSGPLGQNWSPNNVSIEIYRWSTAQQTYYMVTSPTAPFVLTSIGNVAIWQDGMADSSILGNKILYTTGGEVENSPAPSTSITALYKSRMMAVDSENPNTIYYSKQVIQGTPVEFSDLFTIYVAPTIGAQGSTGNITAMSSLDDKLIIFKKDAIYYIVGNGPDVTGANNDFSDPIFISSTVGCANQQSIVQQPNGLMFQSDKGIWLLGRDLSTQYIGAPVEQYNSSLVLGALAIPGTNQVRFTLDGGVTLVYDYFFDQWCTFNGIPGIASTLFGGFHTFADKYNGIYQEAPGTYTDGANPVLLSFTTAWMHVAGIEGFERAYFFYLLGQWVSPHTLTVSVAFDYALTASQSVTITPTNIAPGINTSYGSDPYYGSQNTYGQNNLLEQWRVFLANQKCQAFQLTVSENFLNSGQTPGAGLTLSALNLVVGTKKGYVPLSASGSVG